MLDAALSAAPLRAPYVEIEPEWIARAEAQGWTWARAAWDRAAATPGAWFDHAKADAAVRIWPRVFKLTDDRFAGHDFRLALWQEVIVRLLIGWKKPVEVLDPATGDTVFEHVRLFRRLLLWVPRKNGKTEFLAALGLLFFVVEGIAGGQGFCFARDEKQGRIVFQKMATMIAINPALARDVATYDKSIWIPQSRSKMELLTGSAEGKHGKSASVIVGDEIHEWRTRDLETFLRQSTGARLQPIELYASTAGLKTQLVGVEMFDETRAILDGRMDDASTLPVIFAAAEDDDWRDEAVWRRANPNIGLSPTIDFLRTEFAKAKDSPKNEAHFRRYHLNQWVESISRWIDPKDWDACAPAIVEGEPAWRRYERELIGRPCVMGLDLSTRQDITARALWFPPPEEGGRVTLLWRFWCPEQNIELRSRVDRVPYEAWARRDALIPTPGNAVDQGYVQQQILEDRQNYDIQRIAFDDWNSAKLISDLQTEGVPVDLLLKVRQGFASLSAATRWFDELVSHHRIDHGGHPVMRWMALNALLRFDRNMNFIPAKDASREKIDGVAAAITAGASLILKREERVAAGVVDY